MGMTKIRLTRLLLRATYLMQREDHVWIGSRLREPYLTDDHPTSIDYISRTRGQLGLIFENEVAIQMFLDDKVRPLDAFVAMARKHRNSVVMTVAELLEYAKSDGVVTPLEEGPLAETLGEVWVTHNTGGFSLLLECRPNERWDWQHVSHPGGAYRFERFSQYAEALISIAQGRRQGLIAGRTFFAQADELNDSFSGTSHLEVISEHEKTLMFRYPVWHTDTDEKSYEVTQYFLKVPPVSVSNGRKMIPADRRIPFDVLAAQA